MATEAVVSFVVERLGNLLIEEALLLLGVHDEVRLIERVLRRMQCLLKDAAAKQKGDEIVRNWVAEIRDLSYDADDIIDTFILNEAAKIARWRRGVLVGCLSLQQISELKTRYKVGKEIRQIKLKIAEISNSLVTYGIKDINDQAGGQDARLGEHTRLNAKFEEKDVVGFKEEMTILKERLINGETRRCVISLVGMGGAGKTTLAKKVYHDVKNIFDCHAFIYLSQQYKIKDVLIRIIECTMSLPREHIEKLNEEDLGEKLSAYLSGKRYLVVIDDIWTAEAWEILKRILPDDSNKSRVMLTTRKKEVALRADQLSPRHEMRLLDDKEGWELFTKRIFRDQNACPSDVEETGRQILAKCHGLPLAIAVLGGLLSTRDVTLDEWSKVLKIVPWHLSESPDESCGEILALSYYDLPHYLKPCFLYLGLFPEDSEIISKKLIRLWIAEGFILQRGNGVLEDVAEDYLNELISRSMIQAGSWIEDGLYKMTNLRKLGIQGSLIAHHKVLSDSIEKLCSLRSLTILNGISISSLKSFAHQSHLYKMYLDGQIEKLPDFPPNLAKLTLSNSQLEQDAIAILEKLPHLRILRLCEGSYCSKQMIFSSEGFPQLEYLQLQGLDLEEWIVERGAMPTLKNVKLYHCEGLKTFPERIRDLLGS